MTRLSEPPQGHVLRWRGVAYAPRAWSSEAWCFCHLAEDTWYFAHERSDVRLIALLSGGEIFEEGEGLTLVMGEDGVPIGTIGRDAAYA